MFYVSKLNPNGKVLWTKLLGSTKNDEAKAITLGEKDGKIYITGNTEGNINGQKNIGSKDAFVIKLNSKGEEIWTTLIGSKKEDEAYSITIHKDDSIYVAGLTEGTLNGQNNSGEEDAFVTKINSKGKKLWTKLIGDDGSEFASSISMDKDGSIYGVGNIEGELNGEVKSPPPETYIFIF